MTIKLKMIKSKQLINIAQKASSESFNKGILDNKKVSEFIRQFKKLSLNEAQFVLKEYAKALERELSKITLIIESSVPLTKEETRKITETLGKQFVISKTENLIKPSLLGGIRFKIGDMVFDNSLKNKIEQIGGVIKA